MGNEDQELRELRIRAPHFAFGLLILLALLPCGCLRAGWEKFDQAGNAQDARRLYEQVGEGRQALLATLASRQARPVVFVIEHGKASSVASPASGQDLLGEQKIVFFQAAPADGATTTALYFSPRDLSLRPVAALAPGTGDATITSGGLIRVWRALEAPVKRPGRHRCIACVEFQAGPGGEIRFEQIRPLSGGQTLESMPVPLPDGGIVYLAEENSRHRLMRMNEEGGARRPLLAGRQPFDVLYPRLLPGGGLVCAANPEGDWRLYRVQPEDAPGTLVPLTELPAAGEKPERYTLATVCNNGRLEASVITLDGDYGFAQILALVQAHNPAVNQKRALLTAALLEADQASLANWPALDWGLFYTPRVGVLLGKPVVSSGDFLAEGIARGILGLTQPLLDYRRNSALAEAARWRARIASDVLQNELNERLGEAAELYFEAVYLRRLLALDDAQLKVAGRRLAFYQKLRTQAEATTLQLLAGGQVREGLLSEQAFHRDRLEFLKKRMKEVCGLPETAPLELRAESFRFEDWDPAPLEALRARALLNHPRMKAAAATLSQAFYLGEAGPEVRPQATFNATYGQSRRQFTSPVDDYITLALSGRYPLAARRARRLYEQQQRATLDAIAIEREAQGRRIVNQLEEAVMDFNAARRDLKAKRASLLYYQEALRVAGVQQSLGQPDDLTRIDPLAVETAETEALAAEAKALKVEWDLGERFAKVWREMGLAASLPAEAAHWSDAARRKAHPSLWVWESDHILANEALRDRLLAACRRMGVGRLYFYLRSDARLLADPATRGKLTQMIALCAAGGIEVWGLLGEPEWIEHGDTAALERAVGRVLEANAAIPGGQGLRGLKLDLEPHAIKGWEQDEALRQRLNDNLVALVAAAHGKSQGKLPLWVDVPVKFFNPRQQPLWNRLAPLCSGVTLMCYFNRPAAIERTARRVLGQAGKPVEIGIELSARAPKENALRETSPEKLGTVLDGLRDALGSEANFSGIALHDAKALMDLAGMPDSADPQGDR